MFQISNTSLIVGLFTLLIFNANTAVKGQGRKIDVEIIVHTPKSGDTIISRKNQTYTGKFIIKNNGPDTIKTTDKFLVNVTFGNVIYTPIYRNPTRNLAAGNTDTIQSIFKMTWDTDNNSTFCGTITLSGNGNDSVKKESKTQLLNNTFCQNVYHDSRLSASSKVLKSLSIYPNPCNGILNIANSSFIRLNIKLFNFIGEEIMTIDLSFNNRTIDLSNIPKGVYFVNFSNLQFNQTRKIIVD